MKSYMICLSVTSLFTEHKALKFHPYCSMCQNFLLLQRLNNVSLCVHSTFFFTIHQLGLLLPFGSCGKCCYEHGCTNVSLKLCFQFLWVYNQKWNFWIIWHSIFNFLRDFHTVSHSSCSILQSYQLCPTVTVSTHSHQHWCSFFCFFFLIVAILTGCAMLSHCDFDLHFPQ